jgi:hypothetical protein
VTLVGTRATAGTPSTGAASSTAYDNDWRKHIRKSEIALAKATAIKRLRSRVRLEASIRADVVLNEMLDEFEAEFDRRVAAGEPFELTSYDQWVVERVDRQLAPVSG